MNKLFYHPLFLFLLPIPFLYLLFSLVLEVERVHLLEEEKEILQKKVFFLEKQKKKYNEVALAIKNADHFFLDKYLENTTRLRFSEETIRKGEGIQETEEIQMEPVFVDDEELKRILSMVEGVDIGSYAPIPNAPQFIIKHFNITKKNQNPQESIFALQMHLIKRESL